MNDLSATTCRKFTNIIIMKLEKAPGTDYVNAEIVKPGGELIAATLRRHLPSLQQLSESFVLLLRLRGDKAALSPVHTSDADEPAVGGTHFHAFEYRTSSYSGVCRRRFDATRTAYLPGYLGLCGDIWGRPNSHSHQVPIISPTGCNLRFLFAARISTARDSI